MIVGQDPIDYRDPELIFEPIRDYVAIAYDDLSMLKAKQEMKERNDKKRNTKKKKNKKNKKRKKKKRRKKKHKKKWRNFNSNSNEEFGEDYENGVLDYQEDYGGTMRFVPKNQLRKRKKTLKKGKKRRRQRKRKKDKIANKWKTISLHK